MHLAPPQGFFVVALTTNRVGAAKAVMDIRRDCLQQLIPAMVVDVVEALSDQFLDEIAVQALEVLSPWLLPKLSLAT
jgi:hypothetical protein